MYLNILFSSVAIYNRNINFLSFADVLVNFMPWLMKEVRQEMDQMVASRQILSDLVREIMQNRAEITNALKDLQVQEETEPSEIVEEQSNAVEGVDEEGANPDGEQGEVSTINSTARYLNKFLIPTDIRTESTPHTLLISFKM